MAKEGKGEGEKKARERKGKKKKFRKLFWALDGRKRQLDILEEHRKWGTVLFYALLVETTCF